MKDEETLLKGKLLFPFIAPPNGGKGTQTMVLSRLFAIPKFDMGGTLREIARTDSELGVQIRERQANGQLVDTPVVIEVLKAGLIKLCKQYPEAKGFILDGFPRNREQANGLIEMCATSGARVAKVFYLKVPDEVILKRAVNRRICPVGGEIYNLLTKPPQRDNVCDVDGATLIQRDDDRPEKVGNRLVSFEEETRPMIALFRENGTLVKLDGNRSEAEVTEEIVQTMRSFFENDVVSVPS